MALVERVSRRPVLTVGLVALAVRVLGAVLTNLRYGGLPFPDAGTYSQLAAQAASGTTGGWDDYTRTLFQATGTFDYPLTLIYRLFGPHILLGQLLVALVGAGTAALTTKLCLGRLPVRYALAAGAVVALLPSEVLWSSLTLKDAFSWVLVVAIALVVALPRRASPRGSLGVLVGLLGLLVLLDGIRSHTMLVACYATLLAALVVRRPDRRQRTAAAALIVLFLPLGLGLGVAGEGLVRAHTNLVAQRAAGAQGARTALVQPPPTVSQAPSSPASPAPGRPGATPAPVPTAPSATPAPAPHIPKTAAGQLRANLLYLPSGLAAMVLEPYPWEPSLSPAMSVAKLEMVVWYPLLALALVGLTTLRRHWSWMAFPLIFGAGIATMWALVEGNFGTAYRHRGEFVWVIALLAALGLQRIVNAIISKRTVRAPAIH